MNTYEVEVASGDIVVALTEGIHIMQSEPIEGVDVDEVRLTNEGVLIAKLTDDDNGRWRATHLHCDHPCHGTHPRYAAAYAKVRERYGHLLPSTAPDDCPKCGGAVWLPVASEEARKLFVMAVTFQMIRGVALAPHGYDASKLNPEHVRDTIAVFLSGGGDAPSAVTESPAGSAPGRAVSPGAEVKE